jgi:DNA-binding SARP family transcriptional activator
MIELRTLGPVELCGPEGHDFRSLVQQPKRLALLAYLALVRPRGFRRRDSLTALFWPDLDQHRARAALRQALHVLRLAVGNQILLSRGQDDISVEPSALWCDAVAFEEAFDGGDPQAALLLYRGDLLDGFFVGGESAELEHWLDEERGRLRRRAARAACDAAATVAGEGDLVRAIAFAWRATELEPASESELRQLLALLDRMGDRSAALALYQGFARRLALDLDTVPAPETLQLMDRIRGRAYSEPAGGWTLPQR